MFFENAILVKCSRAIFLFSFLSLNSHVGSLCRERFTAGLLPCYQNGSKIYTTNNSGHPAVGERNWCYQEDTSEVIYPFARDCETHS